MMAGASRALLRGVDPALSGDFVTSLPPQPLSPLDGRYRPVVAPLADYLSEAGLNRARVEVEVEWLLALTDRSLFGSSPLRRADKAGLRALYKEFGQGEIDWLAEREAITRHDVKAVEYLVRDRLERLGLAAIAELTHFACTSEDINSTAYALTIKRMVTRVWLPKLTAVIDMLMALAASHRDAAMLAHTHGQPATPTTMGKEIGVFAWRLRRVAGQIQASDYLAKFSGATGTWSAHLAAEPNVDWLALSREFIESLDLGFNPVTTQIESHDWQVELYDRVRHAGGILHNFATDVWAYISLGYFAQTPVAASTGSSTMPHKINPIRFENAEANLEISGGLFATFAQTLVTSRLQRDLTDSTTQRNIGVAFGHSLLALDNLQHGLGEISLAADLLSADLEANWQVLAEAVQTVVRAEISAGRSHIADPYALLKELTRGRCVSAAELAEFVRGLDIGDEAKQRLLALTPATYTGLASAVVDEL
jgi:adenylosuccinate lyase